MFMFLEAPHPGYMRALYSGAIFGLDLDQNIVVNRLLVYRRVPLDTLNEIFYLKDTNLDHLKELFRDYRVEYRPYP